MKGFCKVEFIGSYKDREHFLYDRPTVTFVGRSNVGKSTLINSLLRRNNFMKTSKKAGMTKMVNYALVDDRFYLADVPGYGYANAKRDEFAAMMKDFLEDNRALKKVYILIDSRRLLLPADDDFADYLESLKIPYAFVFTKVDKLKASEKTLLHEQEEKCLPAVSFEVGFDDAMSYQKLRDEIINAISH